MIFEDKFRSMVRIFWFLTLVASPSLIMWGYYEAHRDHALLYKQHTGSLREGESPGCSLTGKLTQRPCNTSETVQKGPSGEQQLLWPNGKEPKETEGSRQESSLKAARVEELEEKDRKLERKIRKQKQLLAKLREEQGRVNTKICESKEIAPVGSRPVIALASLPGSGNTWVRHLLESASGFYTGSVYKDKRLFRAGFFGEYENPWSGTVLVIKSHKFRAEEAHNYDTAIVLVRNPYKAMISEYNRRLSGKNHTAVGNQSDFAGRGWYTFVRMMGEKWFGVIQKWLQEDPDVHIVYYEDVITNTRTELGKMLTFLNIDIDTARMDCTMANQEGSFHRKSSDQFDPFTEEQKTYVDAKIQQARKLLSANQKPALPKDYSAEVLT